MEPNYWQQGAFQTSIDGGLGRGLSRALGLPALGSQTACHDQYSLDSMIVRSRLVTLGSAGSGDSPVMAKS